MFLTLPQQTHHIRAFVSIDERSQMVQNPKLNTQHFLASCDQIPCGLLPCCILKQNNESQNYTNSPE